MTEGYLCLVGGGGVGGGGVEPLGVPDKTDYCGFLIELKVVISTGSLAWSAVVTGG